MDKIFIEILIVIFNILLFGGIFWAVFLANPRRLSPRRLAAVKAANLRGSSADSEANAGGLNADEFYAARQMRERGNLNEAGEVNARKFSDADKTHKNAGVSADTVNLRVRETGANKSSAGGVNLSEVGAIKRLSVRSFLFWLDRLMISREELWFDEDFIYVFDGQNLAAAYKFERILELKGARARINNARVWKIRFASEADEREPDGAAKFSDETSRENALNLGDDSSNLKDDSAKNGARKNDKNSENLNENGAQKSPKERGSSEYKFLPATSIFNPNFKKFLQILREKNPEAVKTKAGFWDTL